ncbi:MULTISPECIES: sigma-70 family RNA polymerase sigma factor [Paenibacillus]|uniref:RNA polymerase, sigma-24 subunit, ECF subfamily n=2 Tax=Paenibacillus lactis TaxID=228574 RepID=G4HMZ1_9BACL|nr:MULTISPECIES: sigma-70 family RNA polymerase sigma factor [Paenibacillus]EHB54356.1 RNA polymerase, sigma-24 subunit, ECF subfamily [Paenibacillus lactis 154]MBP1891614.1 RNA polymerase sigma-70 factor (ECF subfamily) [Paenibacillus lactis]MCM3494077.1 sigma-70 family RNA polymerase sigma factor [Paenibacillus lactis]HAG00382.1 RNA polymerase subunit sigma [Paenibacillus lactis]
MQGSDLTPWLQRLKEGDKEAFRYVYDRTVDNVYRTVALLVSGRQDIEDIMNEIYFKLWLSLPNYDPNRPFRNWLHGIAIRQVQDWRRRKWRKFRLFERQKMLEIQPEHPRTDRVIVWNETSRELLELLNHLSYKLRIVVVLRYYHEYSLTEISELLAVPIGTVKSRHHQALKELRKHSVELDLEKGGDCFVH